MRLRTRLILGSSYLALLVLGSIGSGRLWLRVAATGLFMGVMLISMSERRLRDKADEHATLNLHN